MKKLPVSIAAGLLLLLLLLFSLAANAGVDIQLTLVNARSGQPLREVKVLLVSERGIRCVRAPCPNRMRRWHGTTDAKGLLIIPGEFIGNFNAISVDGYMRRVLRRQTLVDLHQAELDLKPKPGVSVR